MARTAPKGLGPSARKLWRDVTSKWDLRPDELRVLEDACREADLIDRLQVELDGEACELTVSGSMGQPVANPLIQEIRQHRGVFARLMGALKLNDDGSGEEKSRSTSARAAAQARWSA